MDSAPLNLVRPHLLNLQAYEPVDTPEDLARRAGIPAANLIKLNGNENPYGCSPIVRRSIRETSSFHVYPDPLQRRARQALSTYVGLPPTYLMAGSGADEIIDLILRLVIEPGDRVIDCPPTFGMYRFATEVCGGEVVRVPRDEDFSVDPTGCLNMIDKRTKVIFIASPNNPTGDLCRPEVVLSFLETGILVVVDETYYEFCGETLASWVPKYPNLVVLRTFSKWAGLAGLRVGYGILSPDLTNLMFRMKPPYNLNTAAEAALIASLEDRERLSLRVRKLIKEREKMRQKLEGIPGIKVWPSQGNFLLCQFPPGRAVVMYRELARRGIAVRYFSEERLEDCLRISVGRSWHTDVLIRELSAMSNL